jgi:hypothetical protein
MTRIFLLALIGAFIAQAARAIPNCDDDDRLAGVARDIEKLIAIGRIFTRVPHSERPFYVVQRPIIRDPYYAQRLADFPAVSLQHYAIEHLSNIRPLTEEVVEMFIEALGFQLWQAEQEPAVDELSAATMETAIEYLGQHGTARHLILWQEVAPDLRQISSPVLAHLGIPAKIEEMRERMTERTAPLSTVKMLKAGLRIEHLARIQGAIWTSQTLRPSRFGACRGFFSLSPVSSKP